MQKENYLFPVSILEIFVDITIQVRVELGRGRKQCEADGHKFPTTS